MAASQTAIEEFLSGPLVTWLATCIKKPETLQVYETFFDGSPFSEVLLQIDPEPVQPVPTMSNFQGTNITFARIKIFSCIIRNIKNIYEEELGQLIISLPDCVQLGRSPASEASLEHFKLLLLLLLGCAVQGPTKEHFILKIKQLPLDTQHDIVECIKRVTDDANLVLTNDFVSERLYQHVKNLTIERDKLLTQWMTDLSQELPTNQHNAANEVESNHLAVELADWKARLRKQRQELEEKSEILAECREELEHSNSLLAKLKAENSDLVVEARRAKLYQDEMDAMRERVERVERLESEAQRYRERLADSEFYKVRVDELREDNRVLLETREMLESQLARARQRAEHVLELEGELLGAKQNLNEVIIERDAAKERIQELLEENIQLQQVTKSVLQENSLMSLEQEVDEPNSGDNSLSEQLTNSAQARALRLELENKKLLSMIESLREQNVQENGSKLLELEKDKKKLLIKSEQLHESCERLKQQNDELEGLFRNAIQENRKLQESIDSMKLITERQQQELQNEKSKNADYERNIDNLNKEKQRVQILVETIKKRADNAEKSLSQVSDELQMAQTKLADLGNLEKDFEQQKDKVGSLEKENSIMQKEVLKLKDLLETKDLSLDKEATKNEKLEKDCLKLIKEIEVLNSQMEKLQDFEKKCQEMTSQMSICEETISTLQRDLINEKLTNDKCKTNLEKLSLNFELLDCDLNIIVENLLTNAKIKNLLNFGNQNNCEKQIEIEPINSNENLLAENATLQVEIATLKSQLHSIQTQQTALQLANSQLVAEKEELAKQQQIQNNQHDTLLLDQITLRSLHEQLTLEYEQLKNEQETIKKFNRDLRSEIRQLKETNATQKERIESLENEREIFKNDSKNLTVLRAEHSKLKDDFRNLFTASERLKTEYRNIQDELKNVRTESRSLRLGQTEMQGELNSTSDLVAGLQLDNAKLQQKCDMLFEMNHNLDADRRALMDHVSQLLTQYHSLLTHSLEDKQHFHLEEKLYTDKVNNLCRQKEKLEEKIMEHYRKLDNASVKKKSFGATLVRKVRKAGSDIINKVPRNRRSWHEERLTQSQFTLSGSGNDSDNSLEEPNREKEREPESLLSLGSVGSRRTVYLSEEEPPSTAPQPPLLVYNRISTVLGAPVKDEGAKEGAVEKKEAAGDAKETAVWYEYGCV